MMALKFLSFLVTLSLSSAFQRLEWGKTNALLVINFSSYFLLSYELWVVFLLCHFVRETVEL